MSIILTSYFHQNQEVLSNLQRFCWDFIGNWPKFIQVQLTEDSHHSRIALCGFFLSCCLVFVLLLCLRENLNVTHDHDHSWNPMHLSCIDIAFIILMISISIWRLFHHSTELLFQNFLILFQKIFKCSWLKIPVITI